MNSAPSLDNGTQDSDLPLQLLSLSLNTTSLGNARPECVTGRYGTPSLFSCQLALSRIPDEGAVGSAAFSQRPPSLFARYGLPHRVVSREFSDTQAYKLQQSQLTDPADGLCAIEIDSDQNLLLGNLRSLKLAAASVIKDCVEGSRGGGMIVGGMIEIHAAACSAIGPQYC